MKIILDVMGGDKAVSEFVKGAVMAKTEYGAEITAAVASGNIYGCQFHPEKSGDVGLNILRAFSEMGGKQ
jgi:imidazoleglycerol phosphate synthase glutamine amidotransferase subunit HisH